MSGRPSQAVLVSGLASGVVGWPWENPLVPIALSNQCIAQSKWVCRPPPRSPASAQEYEQEEGGLRFEAGVGGWPDTGSLVCDCVGSV